MQQPTRFPQRLALLVLGETFELLWQLHPSSWRPYIRAFVYSYPYPRRARRAR